MREHDQPEILGDAGLEEPPGLRTGQHLPAGEPERIPRGAGEGGAKRADRRFPGGETRGVAQRGVEQGGIAIELEDARRAGARVKHRGHGRDAGH
jgi:hypothetical protein